MAANAPTITLPAYCALVVKSRLMPSEIVKDQFELWQSRNSNSDDLEAFRRHLVKAGFLSEYQSVMLARGHADGFQLGTYIIQDRIGKGRMAGVFRAIHSTGQVVAIKVLPPSSAQHPMLLSRFQREAKLLIKLDHPNVVRAFEFGESGGKHYFAMEYLEGETLDEMLSRRGKLPVPEAVQIAYQAMRGLEHLHARGMVHRDVKPANIILIPGAGSSLAENALKANAKLLDIGLGKSFFDESGGNQSTDLQLTGEGVLLGTPDYMPPEQARNAAAADIRADIYSLGCVLFHCLTGQPPFPDRNLMNQIIRHATEPMRPLGDFLKPVPDGLQSLVDRLTAKHPDERFQTPAEAIQAMKPFIRQLPEAPASTPPSPKYLQWLRQAHGEVPAEAPAAKAKDSGRLSPARHTPRAGTGQGEGVGRTAASGSQDENGTRSDRADARPHLHADARRGDLRRGIDRGRRTRTAARAPRLQPARLRHAGRGRCRRSGRRRPRLPRLPQGPPGIGVGYRA